MRARRGRQRPAPQPIATAFVTELPAVAAGAMQPSIRAYYNLEELWTPPAIKRRPRGADRAAA